jgi:hypothetical protein
MNLMFPVFCFSVIGSILILNGYRTSETIQFAEDYRQTYVCDQPYPVWYLVSMTLSLDPDRNQIRNAPLMHTYLRRWIRKL